MSRPTSREKLGTARGVFGDLGLVVVVEEAEAFGAVRTEGGGMALRSWAAFEGGGGGGIAARAKSAEVRAMMGGGVEGSCLEGVSVMTGCAGGRSGGSRSVSFSSEASSWTGGTSSVGGEERQSQEEMKAHVVGGWR